MLARVLIFYVIPKITVHILICVVIAEIRCTHFIFFASVYMIVGLQHLTELFAY